MNALRAYCRLNGRWHQQLLALCALLTCALTSCRERSPDDSQAQLWRFAIEESEGSVQHAYALRFKELIEQRSDGRVEVVVYPYGTLGTSTQLTEQLNLGVIELAMASPGSLGKFIPELQIFLLHFVLSEDDGVNRRVLADARLLQAIDALYADKGFKLLAIFPEGEMVWTTKKQVRRPEDFTGVKMRVMTSPILLEAYDAYGASATPLPYSEVYSALQLNMIDGQVNPVFAIERQKFHEVTSHLTFPKHAHFVTTTAANRTFYANLSPSDRVMLQEVIEQLNDEIFEHQQQLQFERLETVIRDKLHKQQQLSIIGDLQPFVESLDAETRRELIEENPFLDVLPPLSQTERAAFQRRAEDVVQTYLEIGGPGADALLDLIRDLVAAEEKAQPPGAER